MGPLIGTLLTPAYTPCFNVLQKATEALHFRPYLVKLANVETMGSALCVQGGSAAAPVQVVCSNMLSFGCCLLTVCKQSTGSARTSQTEDLHSTSNQVPCAAEEDVVATAGNSQTSSVVVQASQVTKKEVDVVFRMNYASTKCLCCQIHGSSELHPTLTAFLKVWDDAELETMFRKYAGQTGSDPSLSAEKLQAALRELGVQESPASAERVELDEFKRIARQPNSAEQWFKMIPFASLLSRSLGKTTLDDLKDLQWDELARGLKLFNEGVQVMLKQRLEKLRKLMNEETKFQNLRRDDQTKFGGVLEGGNVDDFHKGLSDRLGKEFLAWRVWRC